MMTATQTLNPLFKCPGGKSWAIERIRAMAPRKYNEFIEPFVGGGSVFLNVGTVGVISDGSVDVANAWWVIQNCPEFLMKRLSEMTISKEAYLAVRQEFNDQHFYPNSGQDAVLRAARFIYLNRCGFNGLIRYNRAGDFNVPFGRHKNPVLYVEQDVLAAHNRLKAFDVVGPADFEPMLEQFADKGDFVFLDSPYDDTFSNYTPKGFDRRDHLRLAQSVYELDGKGAKFLLTNSNTPFIRALYADFRQEVVPTRYSIGAQKDSRKAPREELFVWNY